MNIDTVLDNFVSNIRADSYFDDIKIVRAYPYITRPTLLEQSVIAVGIADVEIEPYSIGSDDICGEVKLFADIYVPLDDTSERASEIFSHICSAVSGMNISSIRAERICAYKETMSYVMKTQIGFFDNIEYGGDGDE